MIQFVNAKLNIGLSITGRRPDGYHDLETLFYPVGIHNGEPANPSPFCDILEIDFLPEPETDRFEFRGRPIDCPLDRNLVVRAVRLFREEFERKEGKTLPGVYLILEKHLPDGAGLGGGSADASFTLRMLNELGGSPFSHDELAEMALRLGADCPFFIFNEPSFGSGIGERLESVALDLKGWWCLIVKPSVYVSTKEAFSGVCPRPASCDLRCPGSPESWKGVVHNDFEDSIFPIHPELGKIKEELYASGAVYASMSGSGSSLYGLYPSKESAVEAAERFDCETFVCLL